MNTYGEQPEIFQETRNTTFGTWLHETVPSYGFFLSSELPRYFNAAIFYDCLEDEESVVVTDQELELHFNSYAKRMNFSSSLDLRSIHHESRRRVDLVQGIIKIQLRWKQYLGRKGFYEQTKKLTPKKAPQLQRKNSQVAVNLVSSNFCDSLVVGDTTPLRSVANLPKSFSPIPKDIEILDTSQQTVGCEKPSECFNGQEVEDLDFKISPRTRSQRVLNEVSKSQYSFALKSLDQPKSSYVIKAADSLDPEDGYHHLRQLPESKSTRSLCDQSQQELSRCASNLSMNSVSTSSMNQKD